MTRNDIIHALGMYFSVKELVCPHTYRQFGERSWQFLDTHALEVLLILRRDILRVPLICNNESQGLTQRGLRCNMCELVKSKRSVYLTMHGFGKAWDLSSPYMSAPDMRKKIIENANAFPCNIRVEDGVSWLHIDVMPQSGIDKKVYLFKA